MGNNQSNCASPDPFPPPNTCNVDKNSYAVTNVPHFCTLKGVGGNSNRDLFCEHMSDANEWKRGTNSQTDDCHYGGCQKYNYYEYSGCCDGCCAIIGSKLKCQRVKYTGNPVPCCLKDYNCLAANGQVTSTDNAPACFSDTLQQNTCPNGVALQDGTPVPNYRSTISSDCREVLFKYCTGTMDTDHPLSKEWIDRWTLNGGGQGSCVEVIAKNISNLRITGDDTSFGYTPTCSNPIFSDLNYTGPCNVSIPPENINAEGYFWAQTVINGALKHYLENGFVVGSLPGSRTYNTFQDVLFSNVCCPYAGVCQAGLSVACSVYNADMISRNPLAAQWCGCHLQASEYESYSANYNIPPQCTPLCNVSGTIPIVGINGNPVLCEQNICIIDNTTVNIANSQTGGGLNFNQICNSDCGSMPCSCIVNGTTIDIDNSIIGGTVIGNSDGLNGGVGISQSCGTFTCKQANPGLIGPDFIDVPCGATGTINPYTAYDAAVAQNESVSRKHGFFWTVVIIGGGLLVLFLLIFLLHPRLYPRGTYNLTPKGSKAIGVATAGSTTALYSTSNENQLPTGSNSYTSILSKNTAASGSANSPAEYNFGNSFEEFNSILNR